MIFSSKIEKQNLGVPLTFFSIFVRNFIFEFSSYYDLN